jgi:arylsulfatase A-like enzyme
MKPIVATLFTGMCLGAAALADAPLRPNILYILADDLGYADVGFMGGTEIHTPHLDRLAREGSILNSFYAQPSCSPTRASLLTGRYVAHTGVYTVVRPRERWGLPLEERTLADALREAGYTTALVGKWHLGEFEPAYRPTRRGFDHQYGMWLGNLDYFTLERDGVRDWYRHDLPSEDEGYATHLIAREACRLIRDQDKATPLFLYLAFNAPHTPLQVPDAYLEPYGALPPDRRIYAGMVAAMDEAIGQVIAALEEQEMLAHTLIIFSSDNGGHPEVGDNGPLRGAKGTVFEGGVRVCAFAHWPGVIPAGTVVDQPSHIIDWYPTLLGLAGGSLEQALPIDGRDIWPMLTVGARSPHDAILLSGNTPARVAVRVGDWKLIQGEREQAGRQPGGDLLYHLADDPGERHNLAAERPDKVAELKQHLEYLLRNAVPPPPR